MWPGVVCGCSQQPLPRISRRRYGCSAVNRPFGESWAAAWCFHSLPVSGIIVFHNWVSFWNVPYLTLRSLWTVPSETLLLPVSLLWSGKTPASFQCCNTCAAFQTAVKEVYLWVFFFLSDFSVCNSLIFYLTHKTFWLGCCPVFLFLLLLLETEYIQQVH